MQLLKLLEATLADPYPVYDRMRSEEPVHHDSSDGRWYLTRYADVAAALRNPDLSSVSGLDNLRKRHPQEELKIVFTGMQSSLIHSDPPVHTRLRGLVNQVFTPKAVQAMTERVQAMVDKLLDEVEPRGAMDVVTDLAHPLPIAVLADVIGLTPEDTPRLRGWADDVSLLAGPGDPESMARAASARQELRDYLTGAFEERRRQPRGDLLTAMVQAEEAGERLSHAELLANGVLLVLAGYLTTTHLLGTGTLSLLRHPEELEKLRAQPGLMKTAVEELVRYESPVQSSVTPRHARADVVIGGVTIPSGSDVVLHLGAANRDPEQFPDPARLDLARTPNHHLGFGAGPHYCLGAPLARLEASLAFGSMLRRFPKLRLEGGPLEYLPSLHVRGLKSLPVRFD